VTKAWCRHRAHHPPFGWRACDKGKHRSEAHPTSWRLASTCSQRS
jgi:hypothetical protein